MAYPANLSRVVLTGVLFGETGDTWAMTFHMQDLGGSGAPPNAGAIMERAQEWFKDPKARISEWAALQLVKANRIGTDGKYLDQNTNQALTSYGAPGCTGAATGAAFPQLTVAVSLLTSTNRGLASRGRFYPPMVAATLGSNGHISPGQTKDLADAAALFLSNVQRDHPNWRIVVASKRGGVASPVTRVAIGDVVDTQQRRRQQLDEKYEYTGVQAAGALPGTGGQPGEPTAN